jgi:hypothetical protein
MSDRIARAQVHAFGRGAFPVPDRRFLNHFQIVAMARDRI